MQKLLISTRKGLFQAQESGGTYKISSTSFLGDPVTLTLCDERDGTWYAALEHGHFGPKLHRSEDLGETWHEIGTPTYPEKPARFPVASSILRIAGILGPSAKVFGIIPIAPIGLAAEPIALHCIPSWSTREIRITSWSPSRVVAFGKPSTPARHGRFVLMACAPTSCLRIEREIQPSKIHTCLWPVRASPIRCGHNITAEFGRPQTAPNRGRRLSLPVPRPLDLQLRYIRATRIPHGLFLRSATSIAFQWTATLSSREPVTVARALTCSQRDCPRDTPTTSAFATLWTSTRAVPSWRLDRPPEPFGQLATKAIAGSS
jgi:hypothetical protein